MRINRKKAILGGSIALLVVFIGMSVVLYEKSTSPDFCKSCHIMLPYYEAWETSSHYFVKCVECHYPPGTRDTIRAKFQALSQVAKYVTRTYGSKPYAEIEDASCLREQCHHMRLLQGKVVFKKNIIFDHKPHLEHERLGKQLRCTSCHSQIVVGNHLEVTELTCFLCHFKGRKGGRTLEPIGGCPSCHRPPDYDVQVNGVSYNHTQFVSARGVKCINCHIDVTEGTGEAPEDRCYICHNDPKRLEKYPDTGFIHENHISKRNIACPRCHAEIQHKVKTRTEKIELGCAGCHDRKHFGEKELYQGIGGIGVDPMPSPMFTAQVDCVGCHVEPEFSGEEEKLRGQTYKPAEAGCIKCHGDDYQGILDSWKSDVEKNLAETEKVVEEAQRLLDKSGSKNADIKSIKEKVANARHNYEFVKFGKGVHNPDYALALLEKSKVLAQEAEQELKGAGKGSK